MSKHTSTSNTHAVEAEAATSVADLRQSCRHWLAAVAHGDSWTIGDPECLGPLLIATGQQQGISHDSPRPSQHPNRQHTSPCLPHLPLG
jgi:hypothetical protein